MANGYQQGTSDMFQPASDLNVSDHVSNKLSLGKHLALKEDLRSDITSWFVQPLIYKKVLQVNHCLLLSDLDAGTLVHHLVQERVMDIDKEEEISSKPTRKEQNLALVRFLHHGGSKAYNGFLCALKETKSHLYGTLQSTMDDLLNDPQYSMADTVSEVMTVKHTQRCKV